MKLEELEAEIKNLKLQIRTLQDIREIEKLQRAYGYYLERCMAQELIDLFSESPDIYIRHSTAEWKGPEEIKLFFQDLSRVVPPESLHLTMQLSGVIDVDANGTTAMGRWYGFGITCLSLKESAPTPGLMTGVYEIEYIKENDVWKMKSHVYSPIADIIPKDGWVPHVVRTNEPIGPIVQPAADMPPFHFKHPVTGKQTGVKTESN